MILPDIVAFFSLVIGIVSLSLVIFIYVEQRAQTREMREQQVEFHTFLDKKKESGNKSISNECDWLISTLKNIKRRKEQDDPSDVIKAVLLETAFRSVDKINQMASDFSGDLTGDKLTKLRSFNEYFEGNFDRKDPQNPRNFINEQLDFFIGFAKSVKETD